MMNKAPLMDEFLCEYIDGTMDYAVRAAFEECVERDSGLSNQVRHLRGTRRLLHEYRLRTPRGLRARVQIRLSQCLPFATPVRPPPTSILVGTATALALAAALVAGSSQYIPEPVSQVRSAINPIVKIQVKDHCRAKRVDGESLRDFFPVRALSSVV